MTKASRKVEQYSSDEDSTDGSGDEFPIASDENDEQQQGEVSSADSVGSGDESVDSEDPADAEEERRKEIREQLANVPFHKLIQIKQQLGAEKFNKAIGKKDKTRTKVKVRQALRRQLNSNGGVKINEESPSDSDSESDESAPETISNKKSSGMRNVRDQGNDLHRDSKKMPSMMSSKRPVSRFRQVVDMPNPRSRDPRFDSLSGHLNEDLFEKSYEFLEKQQQEEMDELRKQAGKLKNKNPEEARRIQKALGSMQSQAAAKQQRKRMQELKRTHRKMETEAVKQGKNPYFLGRRDLKDLEVAQKFNKLKDSSKLDRFLEKRRKRNATKDHRRMPYQRRDE
ncbi:rRNA biogenesis protein rrp36 [Coemansia guatemalensis]|uniref:rRNA biogenesis protein RRP36 n=1 Tax=Coemansia guatemalensis TaxID=2761395 RepID=A0A9W8LPN8_9FUNG|nr:rRNA biogenesis protein rrp36 [Coemansia guatemalensis]